MNIRVATMSKGFIVTEVKKPETIEAPKAVKNIEPAKNSYSIRSSLDFENVASCALLPTEVLKRIPVHPRQSPKDNLLLFYNNISGE